MANSNPRPSRRKVRFRPRAGNHCVPTIRVSPLNTAGATNARHSSARAVATAAGSAGCTPKWRLNRPGSTAATKGIASIIGSIGAAVLHMFERCYRYTQDRIQRSTSPEDSAPDRESRHGEGHLKTFAEPRVNVADNYSLAKSNSRAACTTAKATGCETRRSTVMAKKCSCTSSTRPIAVT